MSRPPTSADAPRWYDGAGIVAFVTAAALILELALAGCSPQDWAALNNLLKPSPPPGALVRPEQGAFVPDGEGESVWLSWPDYCATYYDLRCPR